MMTLPDFRHKQCLFYFSEKLARIRFKASNVYIQNEDGETKLQHSCHNTLALFIVGNFTITNIMLKQARKHGFPVFLLSHNLKLESQLNNRAEGNFLLRQKQYCNSRSDFIAKSLVRQKINNQINLLKSLRYKAAQDTSAIVELEAINLDKAKYTQDLMGMEGMASKLFFGAYFRNLDWKARRPRTKFDIPNLLLDIGYTYLFNFMDSLVAIYGFDPYCGVYHKFFYQRKSLICDLVEPFRCIIDHRLRMAYNLKQIDFADFKMTQGEYYLPFQMQKKYTALFLKDILDEKDNIFTYIQSYYRWFMKDKPNEDFPIYHYKAS